MNKQLKILFVVADFWQAGAQRYAYEVDLALNKNKFEVHILSYRDLNSSKYYTDYYYEKHIKLGSKIHFVNIISPLPDKSIIEKVVYRFLPTRFRDKLMLFFVKKGDTRKKKLSAFLNEFDIISWAGEYTVAFLVDLLEDNIYDKSIIHIMNARFQGVNMYDRYPKSMHYIFTSGFDDQKQLNYELSEIQDFEHFLFPLFLNINVKANLWKFAYKKKKIGIFTRLDLMKPLDPFMYAFHLLQLKMPDIELHIFGSGDPLKSGIKKYTTHLGIEENVFFRGHVENISDTAVSEELDLVWYQGYKNRPGGYAGFDICLTGIPQIFWEFTYLATELDSDPHSIYPIYKRLDFFVEKSYQILNNQEEASRLSSLQFNDTINERDMKKKIYILEDLYVEVALRNSKVNAKIN